MQRALLAGTALAAVGILAAGPAVAEDKPISMSVGGYFYAYYAYASQDDGAGEPGYQRRSHGLFREAEVFFNGRTKLDNGLIVAVEVQLEAEDCNDQIDESYIYFESKYGRLQIGSDDSAPEKMYYGAPSVAAGLGVTDPTFGFFNGGAGSALIVSDAQPGNISGDREKLSYFTPRFSGFQVGLSYTPEGCEEGDVAAYASRCGGSYRGMVAEGASAPANTLQDIVEIAANYVNKFGDVSVAAFGSYGRGDTQNPGVGREDRTEWGLGAQLGYAGFSVGGAYRRDDRGISSNGDQTDWNVGVGYATGPWAFSLGYGAASQEQTAGGEDKFALVELAARYNLGPGIELAAAIQRFDIEDSAGAAANENAGWAVAVGTALKF
jgi:hypothetical protein